jgi:hypothetical protein
MPFVRLVAATFFWAVLLGPALFAQPAAREELVVHAYTFKHKPAAEALVLIYPLLSRRGAVELQPGGNTLVVRDTAASLQRIRSVLESYDLPARPLAVEILIVRASRAVVSPPVRRSDLPASLTRWLRDALPYEVYETQARAQLTTREGQAVTYGVGPEFEVRFRLGTLLAGRRIKLANFQVSRRPATGTAGSPAKPLIHTTLNLWLDQPLCLGLAKSEASRDALMVVLTLRNGEPVRRTQKE